MDGDEAPERRSVDQRSAAFEIPDEIAHDLKKPVKRVAAEGQELTRLSFRPPTVGEMKKVARISADKGDAEGGIQMLVLLSNDKLTAPEAERINAIDFQIIMEKLEPFTRLAARSAKS